LYKLFRITAYTHLVDVGGDPYFWNLAQGQGLPAPRITIVNLYSCPARLPENTHWVVADGRQLPFPDSSFDIAFSNSVIEHLANWGSQVAFASEIRRVAHNYFLQTPNKMFPIEPHFITPFIHWLPKRVQRKLLYNFSVRGLISRPSPEQCDRWLAELKLLGRREFSELFPEARILSEDFLGLSKSLIAVRTGF
jgi:hypothetical protein